MELSLCVLEVHCIARCSLIRLPHRKLSFSKNRNVCLLKARMHVIKSWQELHELELRPLSLILFKSVSIW